jgi:selenide, water dikinase
LAAKFVYADNTMRTWKSIENKVAGINGESLLTLCDPQTNGGLLLAIAPEHDSDFVQIISSLHAAVYKVGKFTAQKQKCIQII